MGVYNQMAFLIRLKITMSPCGRTFSLSYDYNNNIDGKCFANVKMSLLSEEIECIAKDLARNSNMPIGDQKAGNSLLLVKCVKDGQT